MLSFEEVGRLFVSVKNLKHLVIMVILYSAGLRVSEVVHLKLSDIDSGRNLIHVKGGKGRRDRYMVLSGMAFEMLRDYVRVYKPRARLFPGQNIDMHLSVRSFSMLFRPRQGGRGFEKKYRPISFDTVSRPICLKTGPIFGIFKSYWDTRVQRQRRYIHTLRGGI